MKSSKKSFTSVFIFFVLVIFVVSVFCVLYRQMGKYAELKKEEKAIMAEIEMQKERTAELERLREYYGSDVYIEQIAREQLGLIKSDEILFVPK